MCLAIPEELHSNNKGKRKVEVLHKQEKQQQVVVLEEELLQPEQVSRPSQYFKAQQYKGAPIMIQTRHRCLSTIT
jgi:flagellar biosynthesis regulator FlbT